MSKRKRAGSREKKRKSVLREVLSWIVYLLIVCVVVYLIVQFVGERTEVEGDSMYPALCDGDNLIVDKISLRFTDPDRFDIVVFPFRYQEDTFYIKRVIGLPGETVQIYDGAVYINGKKLDDPYGKSQIENPGLASELITLGENEYFVLGDNRNNSTDSREPSVGKLEREQIIGRAVICIWPLDRIGFLD